LHGDIFHPDPESVKNDILNAVRANGQWDMSESDMLCGHGMALLRKGPETYMVGVNDEEFFDYNIYFGYTSTSHAQREQLRFDIDAFGLNLSGSMGYPLLVTGGDAMRMQWIRGTVSDNNVLVNDKCQSGSPEAGFPLHFEDAGFAKVMDIEAPDAYEDADIYRRTVVTVEGCDGVDYAVDFFRVLGGSEHVYSFHGATTIEPATEGLEMVEQPFGTYAGADVKYDYDGVVIDSAESISGNGYNWLRDVSRDNDPETTFSVDWAIEDFHHRLPTSAGIHLKLTMLSEEPMTEVALAEGQPAQNGRNPDHLEYVLVRRSGEEGMDTLFTAVVEPYQHDSYIASSELVDVELIEGNEHETDRAAAVKVIQKSGRVDYVLYATNPECTYMVDDRFEFRGSTGVVTYEGEQLTYAWGSEATKVADVIEDAKPRLTGHVTDFTKEITMDGYYITVELDEPASAEMLKDRWIYINNDGWENAVYPIRDAEVNGTTAVLSLEDKTLVREFVDELDFDKGYKYNIAEGQTFSIPLSATFDASSFFVHAEDQVIKAGNKFTLTTGVAGAGVTYEADGLATGMKFNAKNGQLDWSTSRTQTGRYPVTVKAIKDGEVMGEMSLVIYVVNYTGSSYAPDKCAHTKAVTYATGETVCPACGTISKKAADSEAKFSFVGSNMTLGNELVQNFMVNTSDLKDGYKAQITHNGETVEAAFTKHNSTYSLVSYRVAAKQMADAIEVVVVDENGNAVSEVYTSSVRDYAMKALAAATSTAKVKTMVVDMLNYGAAAQTYFGYNEKDLANKLLTAAQKGLATDDVACTDKRVKGENYYGSNLSLEDSIILNLYFQNCKAGMTAKVTYKDYKGRSVSAEAELVKHSGSTYMVAVDEIVLADAFSPVTVTVMNGEKVHGTATDSVESYGARAEGGDLYAT
ncbi:MAG: hypothetical protein IJO88_08720, partial [Oscillospiraceae bacterium]|nr:hypothetical protein [Oscillospiraceae bacterium]